ncbi:hypothetical protein ACIOHS_30780 [Streptomyces sp. NPDC088253]|uniref:hypothetical protein n=1 Tax=Streptomyces sp. NPDC088253 TaxID=3365846 RepID=UPI00380768EE
MWVISSIGFPVEAERRVMAERTVLDMWRQLLVEAFSERYKVSRSKIPNGLPYTSAAYFKGMQSVIDEQIAPLVSIRNSLAHGQWVVAFNEQRSEVNGDRTKKLNGITLWHLRLQRNMLNHLERLIFDLMVTQYAFERDFDKHWSNLQAAQIRLRSDKSKEWESLLRKRHLRGKVHKSKNYRKLIEAGLI